MNNLHKFGVCFLLVFSAFNTDLYGLDFPSVSDISNAVVKPIETKLDDIKDEITDKIKEEMKTEIEAMIPEIVESVKNKFPQIVNQMKPVLLQEMSKMIPEITKIIANQIPQIAQQFMPQIDKLMPQILKIAEQNALKHASRIGKTARTVLDTSRSTNRMHTQSGRRGR